MLRFAPGLTLLLILAPVGAGLVGTALPAFGVMPALGEASLSLAPWTRLWATPGFGDSLRLTLVAGLGATLLSLLLAMGFCALAAARPRLRFLEHGLAPLLATPHVALAIGFAFLIAPSGWLVRLFSPWLTGWEQPPGLITVRDPLGLSFIAGLALKETPFLVLMMLSAQRQIPVEAVLRTARALGHGAAAAWVKAVFPQIYAQVRLPLYAVLAFSLSTVEVGLILAPGNPPPLAVLAARWFLGYDLSLHAPASAAAMTQLLLIAFSIALWRLGEIVLAGLGRRWIARGARRDGTGGFALLMGWISLASGLLSGLALATLALWSLAQSWRFPSALPERWTPVHWLRWDAMHAPALATLGLGVASAALAVILALACLETEARRGLRPGLTASWILALPLLLPQIGFLAGTQVVFVRLEIDGTFLAVAWAHLVFVMPYVFLSLADPYRALDPRYARIAAGLGAAPGRVFWRVKMPMLLRPILIAFAVGFAVSVSLYLPTLFGGAGRIATLTTEAVTLSAGGDRRAVAVLASLQALLPLLAYALALAVPALAFRSRRDLQ